MKNLTDKQRGMCLEYVKDFDYIAAAKRSGYSHPTLVLRLLGKSNIQNKIKELMHSKYFNGRIGAEKLKYPL